MKEISDRHGKEVNLPGTTATSLLLRVQQGEPGPWQRFVHLYTPLVYRWCRQAGLPPEDAGDLVQEVFLAVVTGISGLRRDRQGDSFRGWMHGITRHKLADYWRRRAGQLPARGGSSAQEQLAQFPAQPPTAEVKEDNVGYLYRRALELVRLEFEPASWEAFWRVTVEGQAAADVAADLGLTVNAVYIAKSRILRRLRDDLGDLLT